MREIKFRAWDSYRNKLIYDFSKRDFRNHTNDGINFKLICSGTKSNGDYYELKLEQFTGMHDCDGKEIYEGDIYHQGDKNILYVVEWIDTGLKGRQITNKSYCGLEYWKDRIKIIGNIHEAH